LIPRESKAHFDGMHRALMRAEDISMMKHLTLTLVLVGAMMALAAEAHATPITGGMVYRDRSGLSQSSIGWKWNRLLRQCGACSGNLH
jgi:hypothetical protein